MKCGRSIDLVESEEEVAGSVGGGMDGVGGGVERVEAEKSVGVTLVGSE